MAVWTLQLYDSFKLDKEKLAFGGGEENLSKKQWPAEEIEGNKLGLSSVSSLVRTKLRFSASSKNGLPFSPWASENCKFTNKISPQ